MEILVAVAIDRLCTCHQAAPSNRRRVHFKGNCANICTLRFNKHFANTGALCLKGSNARHNEISKPKYTASKVPHPIARPFLGHADPNHANAHVPNLKVRVQNNVVILFRWPQQHRSKNVPDRSACDLHMSNLTTLSDVLRWMLHLQNKVTSKTQQTNRCLLHVPKMQWRSELQRQLNE